MNKKEKVERLLVFCGINENLKKLADSFLCSGDIDEIKFMEFVRNVMTSNLAKVFQEKLSEESLDDLLVFFSNQNLQKSLGLLNELSDEALRICDIEIQKFLDEELLRKYAQDNADKGEVN